jgi:hypothetical protein
MMAKAKKVEETGTDVAVQEDRKIGFVDDGWGDYTGPKGTENFGQEDVNIPRLKLLQDLSPEVKDGIGEPGDLLHSITKTIIAKKGERLKFIPVAGDKQFILWRDRNDGGGIFARANRVVTPDGVRYMWDKQNQTFEHKITQAKVPVKWTTKRFIEEDGLSEFGTSMPGNAESGPAATLHYNYVIMLPELGYQMVAISLSRTAAKRARDLIAILKMGHAPQWARILELATVLERKDNNSWYNWAFSPFDILPPSDPMVPQLQAFAAELTRRGVNVDFSDEEQSGSADNVGVVDGKATGKF